MHVRIKRRQARTRISDLCSRCGGAVCVILTRTWTTSGQNQDVCGDIWEADHDRAEEEAHRVSEILRAATFHFGIDFYQL